MDTYITKSSFRKIGNKETTITSIYKIIDGKEIHYKTIENTELPETAFCQTAIKDEYFYTEHSFNNLGRFSHYKNDVIKEGKHKGQLDHPYNATSIEYIISSSDHNKFNGKIYPSTVFDKMRLNYFRDPIDRIYNDYMRSNSRLD